MATSEVCCYYCMYILGEVESGWDWTAVNRSDPITIGMLQNCADRAANCIRKCRDTDPEGYETFAAACPTLVAAVDTYTSWSWWMGYYLTDVEANAWQEWATRDLNHQGQEELWVEDWESYLTVLQSWGFSLDANPKALIYAAIMYHQQPTWCNTVVGTVGGSATLDAIHSACMSSSFSLYSNRYNTAYNRLRDWDEETVPDFGQNGEVGSGSGGQNDDNYVERSEMPFSRVQLDTNIVTVYGIEGFENGIKCYRAAPDVWIPYTGYDAPEISDDTVNGGDVEGEQAALDMRQWLIDHVGAFYYTQNAAARLSPETSGGTDCSALMWYVYKIIPGIEVGTWTGAQQGYGTVIADGSGALPQDQMEVMDLVFFMWGDYNSSYDHVEAYIGNNQLIGHGGPGNGPTIKEDADAYASRAYQWRVRRYL